MKRASCRLPPILRHVSPTPPAKPTLSLPNLSVYNARSLLPKISSFAIDVEERATDISFITEIWEQDENKKHQKKVEKLLELKGIKYISKPRRNRLGGGAAIAVNLKSYSLSKLNVHVPTNVECVWGLAKPLKPNKSYSSFICCSFYSPPDLHKNPALVDHMTVTLQNLLNTHRDAGIFICGDRNQIDISSQLIIDPSLNQIVLQPTHTWM